QVTEVVRKLDEAGVRVQHLEINEPSLDDVFAEATGHRLEGADNAPSAGDNGDEQPQKKKRRGKK
ncbi:MAG: daunorubicin/doxorubicin resistance ABC transporter ATP-binding protein DrrA, partial [Actinomycetota bacterium]